MVLEGRWYPVAHDWRKGPSRVPCGTDKGTRGAILIPWCPVAQRRVHPNPIVRVCGKSLPASSCWCRTSLPPGTLLSTAHCTNFSSTLRCLQQHRCTNLSCTPCCLQQQSHNIVQHYCTNFTCAPSCLQQQSHNKIPIHTLLALHRVFNNNGPSGKLYKFHSVF